MLDDYKTERMEAEWHQKARERKAREAAIHILNGMDEKSAVTRVENDEAEREDAVAKNEYIPDEDDGVANYSNSELDPLSDAGMNQKQIDAVQRRLLEERCW